MSYVLIILLFLLSSQGFSEVRGSQGCMVPESGPQKGVIPEGCGVESKPIEKWLDESLIRCKVVDVKCDPQMKQGYIAVAQVEKWLRGEGPRQIEFKFKKETAEKKNRANPVRAGRGLCADITLEKRVGDWHLLKIENPTSSTTDSLPSCP